METPRQQEARGRHRISWRGIFAAAATAGAWTFIFSGGSPWSSAGTMNAVMGRDVPVDHARFFVLLVEHFAVALLYAAVLGAVVYRFRVIAALGAGLAVGAALYLGNLMVFRAIGGVMQTGEGRAIVTHAVFAVFATLVYKAAGVPRPRATRPGEDVTPSAPDGPRTIDSPEG